MVDFTNDTIELRRRYNSFVFGPDVPEIAREKLQTIPGSDADIITQGSEILYAHRDLLSPDGLEVLAMLYGYANGQGWSAFCKDGRCDKIVQGIRGDLDEIQRPRLAENDPEPNTALRSDGVDWRTGNPAVAPLPTGPATETATGVPLP